MDAVSRVLALGTARKARSPVSTWRVQGDDNCCILVDAAAPKVDQLDAAAAVPAVAPNSDDEAAACVPETQEVARPVEVEEAPPPPPL